MQLTRWNPLAEIDQLQQRLNRVFLDPASPVARDESFADFVPAIDVYETDAEFVVTADLPDVKKNDVKVQVQDGMLSIEGERQRDKEEKGKRFHRVEREYGRFVRRLVLSTEVDAAKVRAEFKDGVLRVQLPKSAQARPKQIEVAIG
jgi:HSP20 family protein